jgi:hypothetical protein
MSEFETGNTTSSRPPPSGLVAHARMERARQLLWAGLDQLCGQVRQTCDEPPASRPSIEVQVAIVSQLLRRQLEFDQSQLTVVAFPVMADLQTHHAILEGKVLDLERGLRRGNSPEQVQAMVEDLRQWTTQYFEWLDGFFGAASRQPV